MVAGWNRLARPPGHFETELKRTVRLRYLQCTPRDYEAQPARDWPLVLFLHGRGERGDDLIQESLAATGVQRPPCRRPVRIETPEGS